MSRFGGLYQGQFPLVILHYSYVKMWSWFGGTSRCHLLQLHANPQLLQKGKLKKNNGAGVWLNELRVQPLRPGSHGCAGDPVGGPG